MSEQNPKDLYIQVGDIKTRYWEAGDTGSPVVLIHGLGGLVEHWEHNITVLSKRHKVYALDLVGFGFTEKPSVPYSISYLANFVQEFMILKNISNACVIGHSLGSGVAFELCLMIPSRVKKLVLTSGFGFGRKGAFELRILSISSIGEKLMQPNRDGTVNFLKLMVYDPTFVTDEMVDVAFEWTSQPNAAKVYLSTLRSFCTVFGLKRKVVKSTLENAKYITIPTLILWGQEDRIIPVEQAHIAKNVLPNANLHVFEKCGHMPQIECAEEFNNIVSDFLRT
jgi:pimeloyl-ACP methyl ester carboxylesterase